MWSITRLVRCIYAVDTFDANLCIWRRLMIYKKKCEGDNGNDKGLCKGDWNLACEYYKEPSLKKENVRATKLVDFLKVLRDITISI